MSGHKSRQFRLYGPRWRKRVRFGLGFKIDPRAPIRIERLVSSDANGNVWAPVEFPLPHAIGTPGGVPENMAGAYRRVGDSMEVIIRAETKS